MKKMTLILLTCALFSLVNAQMDDKMEDNKDLLINYLHGIKNRSIEEPADMVQKWVDFKAAELKAGIRELIKMKMQIQDPEIKEAWNNLLKTKTKLLIELQTLPIPEEGFKKSLADKVHWLKLEAKRLSLMAEQLRIIADQTGSRAAAVLAEMKDKKAQFLKGVYRTAVAGKVMGAAALAKGVEAVKEHIAEKMGLDDDMEDDAEMSAEESLSMD